MPPRPQTTRTLLVIDASPRAERSHSRKLSTEYVSAWRDAHPNGKIVIRDLAQEPPPFVSEAWVVGAYAPSESQPLAAKEAIAVSNRYEALAKGKRVKVIVTSGGDFRPDTPAAGFDFLSPYLRGILGFIGISVVEFIYAHSLANDAQREPSLTEAQGEVRKLAAA